MQETRVQFLGREDPLEKEMATHASILAWRILWREEPGRLQSMGLQESDTTERLNRQHRRPPFLHIHLPGALCWLRKKGGWVGMDGIFHRGQRRSRRSCVWERMGCGCVARAEAQGLPSPRPYPGVWLTGRLLLVTQNQMFWWCQAWPGCIYTTGMGKQHGSGYPSPSC